MSTFNIVPQALTCPSISKLSKKKKNVKNLEYRTRCKTPCLNNSFFWKSDLVQFKKLNFGYFMTVHITINLIRVKYY